VRNFEYLTAETTEQAVELLGAARDNPVRRARIIAGGTDLLDELKEGLIAPGRLVNLKANGALRFVRFDRGGGLRIGALTTLSELEEHEAVGSRYPGLAAALAAIASPQIRNMATVGGNLCQRPRCWYYRDEALLCARKRGPVCYAMEGENTYHAILGGSGCIIVHPSDLAPALMAHDAEIAIVGPDGRRTLPLEDFFIGPDVDITRENVLAPDEIVEEVSVPAPGRGSRAVFLKVRDRGTWDFATLSVAAVLEMDGPVCRRARVVLGAVAPVPWPLPEVDAMISGARVTTGLADRAAEAALRGAAPLEHNEHKVPMAKNLVRRAILQAAGIES
jgi:xanthine dehydrogenase YagS FAD-binding subunit